MSEFDPTNSEKAQTWIKSNQATIYIVLALAALALAIYVIL